MSAIPKHWFVMAAYIVLLAITAALFREPFAPLMVGIGWGLGATYYLLKQEHENECREKRKRAGRAALDGEGAGE